MKNPYIIPAAIIGAAILGGFWILKPSSELQKVIVVRPPDISIHDAAHDGNIEAVKQHLATGANVNAKGDAGGTPLQSAAYGDHKEIAELLIVKGADVNAKNIRGVTPLDFAKGEIANLLRKHGGKTKKELEAAGN